MQRKQLISKYHLIQNRMMHKANRGFGGSGYKWAQRVKEIIEEYDIYSVLDYGCGECSLYRKARPRNNIQWVNYDPAVKGCEEIPTGWFDLITCTDVLEHIEPKKLDHVLEHIFSLSGKFVFFVIALNPANKTLPDGRNTHLILEEPQWWINKILTKVSGEELRIGNTPRPDKDLVLEVIL